MEILKKTCANKFCQTEFFIDETDQTFYQKMQVLEPKICADCRQIQRLAFRNERKLYHNICKLCKKPIVSIYSADKSYPVYCVNCWWGDGWNALDYGKDFDFNRPFFEQFKEVWSAVPKLGLLVMGDNINSEYAHDAYRLVNCYLTFDGEQAKDCYYGETFSNIQDCCDFLFIQRCELCYESVNCYDSYNLDYSRYCHNCSDSSFLYNCRGCRNCFGCINLQQKEFYIFNKPYSPEEYKKIINSYNLSNFCALQKMKQQTEEFFQKFPKKYINGIMNENVTGNNLNNCKDTFDSYDCSNLRDCRYCTNMLFGATDSQDISVSANNLSLSYNSIGVGAGAQNIIATLYACFGAQNIYHSIFCINNVENLLGCIGLQHKKFCILNKQYNEAEYKNLLPKIIEHMKKTGEWGTFFPSSLSPFGYNETVAEEYYPLRRENALIQGFNWKESDSRDYLPQTIAVPEDIQSVTDEITKEILACVTCKKNFKITVQELKYYRKKNIPVPGKCSDCRHKDRLALRNQRKLFDRICAKCKMKIQTTCDPRQPDIVYCERCYLKEVY